MRSKSITLAVASLAPLFVAFAIGCAGSTDEEPSVADSGVDAAPKADTGTKDAGPVDSGKKVCVQTCQSDSECANSCAAVSTGSSCCDLATNTCYHAQDDVCPVQDNGDGSTPTNPY